MSERQARLISQAVELYARLGTGQFKTLEYFFWSKLKTLNQARPLLEHLQMIKNGSLTVLPGIYMKSVNEEYKILYDLHQVIRHRLAWDRDPECARWTVDFREPLRASKREDLAKIELTTDKKTRKSSKNEAVSSPHQGRRTPTTTCVGRAGEL